MYKTIWQRAAELMLELIRANGRGGSLSVGCINPEKIVPILAGINDNPINVDLTFKKKIKVI